MDYILKKYLPRIDFSSYEDFKENFKINIPDNFNFGFDVVDEWAKVEPEKKALVWCDDHGGEKTFTFSEISRLSNKTANYLLSLGFKKGDKVLFLLRRRWEYWIYITAMHKLGIIAIPATIMLTAKDIVFRGNRAGIKGIVGIDDDYVVNEVNEAAPQIPTLKYKFLCMRGKRDGWIDLDTELEKCPDTFERPTGENATKRDDTMLMFFTSGTTGNPKTVMHNFSYPMGHIITAKYWQQVQENGLHLSCSDSGWAKFSWGKIYGQWMCGACIFCYDMDKFIPSKLLEHMQKYEIKTFCCPPTMYRFMLQEDVKSYDLSSIDTFTTAGEPLNPEVTRKWQNATGKIIREGFGQTEGPVLLATFPWISPKPGAVGKPSPLYDIHLLGKDGKYAKVGEEGAIIIDNLNKFYPPGLFVGYYADPQKTAETVGGKYYNLHDMAAVDEDGYYHFIGRNDDVIKCSGYRIGPFEVESAVLEHPACVECAITAAPDPIRGQVVKATIVLAKGYKPSPELVKDIQNHVKHSTAPYKYPRIVEFVDELPKTIGGKIKRAEIRHDNFEKK